MPVRCSLLMIALSRHTDWIELKKPFHTHTQTRAKHPVSVPSCVRNKFLPTTKATRPEISAAIGSTFQSFWYTNILRNFPR